MELDRSSLRAIEDLVAGTVGGVAGIVAGQPLDTVKVRLQTATGATAARGSLHCALDIMRRHGPLGFFRGMLPPILGNAPINALIFVVYGNETRRMREAQGTPFATLRPSQHLMAGGLAGLSQCVIATPMELVKIRLQAQNSQVRGPLQCALSIGRKGGLHALYRGWWLTVARDVPAFGLYFWSYEATKRYFATRSYDGAVSVPELLLSGGVAGAVSWAFTYPIDVVKSLHQVEDRSLADVARLLKNEIATDGGRILMRGFTPTVLRAFPVSAVVFFVYEWLVTFLDGVLDPEASQVKLKHYPSGGPRAPRARRRNKESAHSDYYFEVAVDEENVLPPSALPPTFELLDDDGDGDGVEVVGAAPRREDVE